MSFYNGNGASPIGQRAFTRTMIAGTGGVTAMHAVKFDVSQAGEDRDRYCVAGAADGLFCGIALADAAAGEEVEVAVKGYVEGVYTDGNVVSGNTLCSAAGAVMAPYAGTETYGPVAVALEDDNATPVVDLYLFGNVLP